MTKWLFIALLICVALSSFEAVDAEEIWDDLEPISIENITRLQPMAVLGRGEVEDIEWSPDDTFLAVAGWAGVWLYDAQDWSKSPIWIGNQPFYARAASFSENGRFLAATTKNGWILWDVVNKKLLRRVSNQRGQYVANLVLSPDGRLLATTALHDPINVYVQLWDTQTGYELAYLDSRIAYNRDVPTLTFTSGGKALFVGANYTTGYLYDVTKFLNGEGSNARIWGSSQTGGQIHLAVAINTNGNILGLGERGNAYELHELPNGEALFRIEKPSLSPSWSLALSQDTSLIATSSFRQITIWDTRSGEAIQELPGHDSRTTQLAFSRDARQLASYGDGNTLKVWDLQTGEGRVISNLHSVVVRDVAINNDNSSIVSTTGLGYGEIQIWDIARQAITDRIPEWAMFVDFNTDRSSLAWDSRCGVQTWQLDKGDQFIRSSVGCNRFVTVVEFSPDGQTLAYGTDTGGAELLSSTTGEQIAKFSYNSGFVAAIAYTSATPLVVTESDYLIFWDFNTGEKLATFPQQAAVSSATCSTDGKLCAVGDWVGTTRIWDTTNFEEIYTWPSQMGIIDSLGISPDNKLIAASGNDGTITLWNTITGQKLLEIVASEASINDIEFSPNGQFIATSSSDGTIRLWGIPAE